ncbi:unnamed protein product [marine sediment metagenome]|uniref:Uracil-DNA glycosylase-like domain-containing protein n=1 Tax=marine sediment metagenome TaxID=412755 RepID=X0Y5U3_9ZZZZ
MHLVDSSDRRESLREEILDIRPEVILTLGQEALDGLRIVSDRFSPSQERLAPDSSYGRRGNCALDDVDFELISTVHPGFLRQQQTGAWAVTHQKWTSLAAG